MKKRFGFIPSLLLFTCTMIALTGCSGGSFYSRDCVDECGIVCEDVCDTVPAERVRVERRVDCPRVERVRNECVQNECVQEACVPCEVSCKVPARCVHPSRNELQCLDGITVTAHNPEMCILGDQYPLAFDVKACDDVCDVVVRTLLPEGVTFIRSQPEATLEGRALIWHLGSMRKGQCIPAKVWLKCECEGELCACFCASATPVRFCSLLCAKPVLTCHKCGPEECAPGDPINYTVTVTNRGSCTATGVVVTDNVPEGLEHASGLRTLTFNLGSLEPCETKKVNMCFTACRRGEICNTATVTACNAEPVSCTSKCIVCALCGECEKVGPREMAIGKNADYTITVANTGDKPLTEVVVTDTAPSATSIVSAPGARICGNQAVWRMRQLDPGERVSFNIALTTCTPGCFTNRASFVNAEGCNECCELTTRWRGRPALTMCISDTCDPVCIGDATTYNISVTNQGSEADQDVRVVVRFPREVEPVSVGGDVPGTIDGNTVTFRPSGNFAPRQTLSYRIQARARASGDARIVAEVSSASIKTPIVQQESTIVN